MTWNINLKYFFLLILLLLQLQIRHNVLLNQNILSALLYDRLFGVLADLQVSSDQNIFDDVVNVQKLDDFFCTVILNSVSLKVKH